MAVVGKSLTGRTLGDFVVCDQIGEGGFGVVYRAEQPLLGREAVIKVARTSSPEFVGRFLREARLASKLDHPYAAHIYAFGSEPDGTLWTAMEIVRGTPLDQLIEQQGPVRLERFAALFDKLCEVVHTAHEQGIIHRDLKPANVMVLSRAGRLLPKLLDLGIAKGEERSSPVPVEDLPAVEGDGSDLRATAGASAAQRMIETLTATAAPQQTRAGKQLGSPAYMAPEQWVDASKVDARTDIYALGILAYEALTGRLPFAGNDLRAIAVAHARKPVPPLGGDLPVTLDPVIAKAMAKKPANRYTTALELATAFREAAGLEPRTLKLPEIDPLLREELVASAPQPLAEAVAALEGVRNTHQAQGALAGVARVIVRLLGGLALAAHPAKAHSDVLVEQLRALRKAGLDDAGWLALARAAIGSSSALPELVQTLADPGELEALLATRSWFEQHLAASEEAVLEELTRATQRLERVLRQLTWLASYAWVAPDGTFGERWMGIRRPARQVCPVRGASDRGAPTGSELVLVDADGAIVLPLWPVFQIAAPAPGHASEVFVLDGANRDGARMISLPTGFERTEPQTWPWIDNRFGIATSDREEHADGKAPYLGLSTFTLADADQFVGREQETEAFANRLRITPLLVVVGASGAGKSSFVQAGVVPALGDDWTTVIARPGTSPVATLLAVMRDAGITSDGDFDQLPAAIHAWTKASKRSLLIYIDQFEELFTLCHDPLERERYAGMLVRAARDPDEPVRVVMTVRDDFLLRCQQVEVLRERLVHGLQLLATPTATDLQRILIEPARRAGYEFEDPALPVEMTGEVASMAAALPLLSFTAAQMWELRDRHARKLTRKAYETLGGVGGALAQHAEKVFSQMSDGEQKITRIAFRNLVTADGTRAVLTRNELLEVLGDAAIAESMLEKLITARLLTASEGVGGDRVEVVHEALLSAWPRLIDWRREDAEGARLRDQLRIAARQWNERGRPRGLLWRGDALAEYRIWRARHPGQLIATELQFADASEAEARRARRLRNGVVLFIVTTLTVGIVVALVLYRDAEGQRVKAQASEQHAIASEHETATLVTSNYINQGQRASVAGDASRALVYLEAARRDGVSGPAIDIPIAESRRGITAERAVYRGHKGNVRAIATMSDGKRFATGGFDRVVNLWDLAAPTTPLFRNTEPTAAIYTLAASHDDRHVAVASIDGRVRVYDATGKVEKLIELGDGVIFTVVFTRDDRRLLAYTENNDVAMYELATGEVKKWHADGDTANVGDLSPDGELLAMPSYDHQVRLWTTTGKLVRVLGGGKQQQHEDTVWNATFSPDGSLIATASWDKTAKLWDAKTGAHIATLVGHSAAVDLVRWNPAGTLVASGSRDGTVRLWDRKGLLQTTLDCGAMVRDLAWDDAGERVVVGCGDATVLFDVHVGLPLFRKQAIGSGVFAVRFIKGGDVLSVEADGAVRRWTPQIQIRYEAHGHGTGGVSHADRCGDDLLLTVSPDDHSAKLWTMAGALRWQVPKLEVADASCRGTAVAVTTTKGELWMFASPDAAPTQIPLAAPLGVAPGAKPTPSTAIIALSPDGKRLAAVDDEHRATLIDLATGKATSTPAASFKRSWEPQLEWARDGSVFVAVSDGGVVVWDGTTGGKRFEIPPPGALVRRIVIDTATDSLFVSAMIADVRRYSLRDGRLLTRYANAAFPWGMTVIAGKLYVGFDNGSVVEYEIASGQLLRIVGSFSADVLSVADAGRGMLWAGSSNLTLNLIDLASRAVVYRTPVPTEPVYVSPRAGSIDIAMAGLTGRFAFVHVDDRPVDLEQLGREVRCRTTLILRDGTLAAREIDLAACQQQGM